MSVMKKTHEKSFFKRAHQTSTYINNLENSLDRRNEIVLQVMDLHNGELMLEVIDRNDYIKESNN